jgi:2-polyprenyl-3-methyl-5-hydroxy-6-metoxy-1,4-benzoquinol methylase
MTSRELAERDQAEVLRSAEEARRVALKPAEVERYLNPPPDTPYALEYAFHLLGDAQGKTVLDFGCGIGENIVPLSKRGAQVTGIDISPELIALADRRLKDGGVEATLKVGTAYDTGLADESVDVIFCIALIHHLDIPAARDEMYRILAKNGLMILSEPIRFSAVYHRLRSLMPAHAEISEHEHPLTRHELKVFTEHFKVDGMRYFRLPLMPLVVRTVPRSLRPNKALWKLDRWILRHCPFTQKYATNVTMRLFKTF